MVTLATNSNGDKGFRLVHERTVVTGPIRGIVDGSLNIHANNEFAFLTSNGWLHVHDLSTGELKFKYRHPEVAASVAAEKKQSGGFIIGGFKIPDQGEMTVYCSLTSNGMYYIMVDMIRVQPPTSLDINGIHGYKTLRYRFVDYRTGKVVHDVDVSKHNLGQVTTGENSYQETLIKLTANDTYLLGSIPPEGRLASVNVQTGELHQDNGPLLQWGFPNPATIPYFVGIGGDLVLSGARAPVIWNARTGKLGPELEVAPAQAFNAKRNGHFLPYSTLLLPDGKHLLAGGHVFDIETGKWLGPQPPVFKELMTPFPRSLDINGSLLYAYGTVVGSTARKSPDGIPLPRTPPSTSLVGFDPLTGWHGELCRAMTGVNVPAGIPQDCIKESRFSVRGIAFTPDGSRLVVSGESSYILNCKPLLDAWERDHPGDLRRVLANKTVDAGLVYTYDGDAIQHAAEAAIVIDQDGNPLESRGPAGELDVRDVLDILNPNTCMCSPLDEREERWQDIINTLEYGWEVKRVQCEVFRVILA